ncbi:putative survival motor neuron-like protein [Dioscorea sansibarensis]
MGMGTDLWDDSALINAFDSAMATYKTMHGGTHGGGSTKEEKHTSDSNHDDHVPTEEVTRNCVLADGGNCGSQKTAEPCMPGDLVGPASDVVPTQEYHLDADAYTSESYQHPTGHPSMHGQDNGYFDQQNEEYNKLLTCYYELEEQRQNVLQRLNQASCWNHQTPAQASMGDMPQISAHNISQNSLHPQCSPCFYQCPASSIVPISCATNNLSCGGPYCCSLSMQCCSASLPRQFPVYPTTHSYYEDDTAVKTAMMAAEKAISSSTMSTPATSNVSEDKEKGKEDETSEFEGKGSKSANPETDLTVVLNAWYAAGFHTGRYLMEQSKRNTS